MEPYKNNSNYRMNIGGASIILILLVFSMAIFAILSIRASYHELKLARNSRSYIENYYQADSVAEIVYAQICEAAAQGMQADELINTVKEALRGKVDDLTISNLNISEATESAKATETIKATETTGTETTEVTKITGAADDYAVSYSTTINDNADIEIVLDITDGRVNVTKWRMKVNELNGYGNEAFEVWEPETTQE